MDLFSILEENQEKQNIDKNFNHNDFNHNGRYQNNQDDIKNNTSTTDLNPVSSPISSVSYPKEKSYQNEEQECIWCCFIDDTELFFEDYLEKLITNDNIFSILSYLRFYYKDCLRNHNKMKNIENIFNQYKNGGEKIEFIKDIENEKVKYLGLNSKINTNFLKFLIENKNENINTNIIKLKFKYDE